MCHTESVLLNCTDGPLLNIFPFHERFYRYCHHFRRMTSVSNGCVRASIRLLNCAENSTGCYPSLSALLSQLLDEHGGAASLIPFSINKYSNGNRTYTCPWDANIEQSYCDSLRQSAQTGHVILMDYYSDSTTLAKRGTQSASFIRIRFLNIKAVRQNGSQW